MSHTRRTSHRRVAAAAGSVAALTLLSGCFGSGSSAPTADHHTRHSRATSPTSPTAMPTTSSPTAPTSSPATLSDLTFDPPPGGKHQKDCERLQPGDDPAEFLYYPVVVTPTQSLTLGDVGIQHTVGVVVAGAWVAPAGSTPATGTFKGWPPAKIVTGNPNLQWSKRVPAKGAHLSAGVAYNVFLRLQVDPTPGDSRVRAIDFTLPSTTGAPPPIGWPAHTTFSMSC